MNTFEIEKKRFIDLISYWHKDHPREDQVTHCLNVMQWLEKALDKEEGSIPARRDMILAALGHDLYEDSAISPAELAAEHGREVDRLIEEMTERSSVLEYVERIASGSEEAHLIKLCDGIDNYEGLFRNGLVTTDPVKWINVVRKQMEPMFSRLAAIPFRKYVCAGTWLGQLLYERREAFWVEIGKMLETSVSLNTGQR